MLKKILILFIFIATSTFIHAEPTKFKKGFDSVEQLREFCTKSMSLFVSGEIQNSFLMITPQWPFSTAEMDNLQTQTIKKRGLLTSRFGQSIGYELIKEEKIGSSFIRLTYIERMQWHAIRWVFKFYKGEERWVLNGIFWDDKIDELY